MIRLHYQARAVRRSGLDTDAPMALALALANVLSSDSPIPPQKRIAKTTRYDRHLVATPAATSHRTSNLHINRLEEFPRIQQTCRCPASHHGRRGIAT
jgi:hypothetical protein